MKEVTMEIETIVKNLKKSDDKNAIEDVNIRTEKNFIGKKGSNYKRYFTQPSKTKQDQEAMASISKMAKKYGIDAIMSKAEATQLSVEQQTLMYGNDYSQLFGSKEDILNLKNKLQKTFELIPARIRKTEFGDDVQNFVTAMTENNVAKLKELQKYGLISDEQIQTIENQNIMIKQREDNLFKEKIESYIKENNLVRLQPENIQKGEINEN